jgi:hypothetical protein
MKKILSAACLFLFTHLAFSQVKTNFTKQNYQKFFIEDCIPKDLTADNHILLVQTPFDESQTAKNNAIDEIFKTFYKSPYVIVPNKFKDFKKTYQDVKIYKYAINFLETMVNYENSGTNNDILHIHYEISIIDLLKLSKSTIPALPEGASKKEQKKFLKDIQKNMDKYSVDMTAVIKTGLEDNKAKINEMVTFLAKKLVNYKE